MKREVKRWLTSCLTLWTSNWRTRHWLSLWGFAFPVITCIENALYNFPFLQSNVHTKLFNIFLTLTAWNLIIVRVEAWRGGGVIIQCQNVYKHPVRLRSTHTHCRVVLKIFVRCGWWTLVRWVVRGRQAGLQTTQSPVRIWRGKKTQKPLSALLRRFRNSLTWNISSLEHVD